MEVREEGYILGQVPKCGEVLQCCVKRKLRQIFEYVTHAFVINNDNKEENITKPQKNITI